MGHDDSDVSPATDTHGLASDAVRAEFVIRPPQGWRSLSLTELWTARELLGFLVWRDLKVRYKQTLLGAAWGILQPTLMMIVLTAVLGRAVGVETGDIPYPLFVYAGLLPWMFFASAVTNASNSVIASEQLVTKVYFPRLAIPFSAVAAALVDFLLASTVFILLFIGYRMTWHISMLLAPVFVALLVLAALGIGSLLAALNVAYRDFRYIVPFMMQLWMFATPSVYMEYPPPVSAAVADEASGPAEPGLATQILPRANPMIGLISAFRAIMIGQPVRSQDVLYSGSIIVVLFLLGCLVFRRIEDRFADII